MTSKLRREIREIVDLKMGQGAAIDTLVFTDLLYDVIVAYNKTYPPCDTCKVVRALIHDND